MPDSLTSLPQATHASSTPQWLSPTCTRRCRPDSPTTLSTGHPASSR
jgi:hypothetical protein